MIVNIPVSKLTIGMYVQKIPCSWTDHPFLTSSFTLDSEKQIKSILSTGVKEVSIDTSKGLAAQILADVSKSNVKKSTPEALKNDASSKASTKPQQNAQNKPQKKQNRQNAIENAKKVCVDAKETVITMFEDVRMGKAIDIATVNPVVDSIMSSLGDNNNALLNVVKLKSMSDYTYMHSVAVCGLMIALAKKLNFNPNQIRQAGLAGLLHDVGKVAISDELLNKPGKLSDEEYELIKSHTTEGYKILNDAKMPKSAVDVCLHHHEKIDGSGYPDGLKGDQISVLARMGAVCDVYDAVTSTRPYNTGWDPGLSLKRMSSWDGHFDKKIFQAFVQCLGIYPVGTLVKLSNNYLAVVTEQNPTSLLQPEVKQFYSIKSKAMSPIKIIQLANTKESLSIESIEKASTWKIHVPEDLWI